MYLKKKYLVSFLIPYFGKKVPEYLNYFIFSCSFNANFQFIFFTDLEIPFKNLPSNVQIIPFSPNQFKNLVFDTLSINIDIDYLFKIVDFKPAYGAIFKNFFDSDYWGHIDIDLVLGDLNFGLKEIMYHKYDILSFRKEWLSGSFAMYRNVPEVNFFFQKSKDWKMVFSHKKHFRFDECGIPLNKNINIYSFLEKGGNIFDLPNEIESFTHLLKNKSCISDLKKFFQTKIKEDLGSNQIVEFSYGRVSSYDIIGENKIRRHFLLYHLIGEKRKIFFYDPNWNKIPFIFFITKFGFHKNKKQILIDIFVRFLNGISYEYYFKTFSRIKLYIKKRTNLFIDF